MATPRVLGTVDALFAAWHAVYGRREVTVHDVMATRSAATCARLSRSQCQDGKLSGVRHRTVRIRRCCGQCAQQAPARLRHWPRHNRQAMTTDFSACCPRPWESVLSPARKRIGCSRCGARLSRE
jgi:hypothetical protein